MSCLFLAWLWARTQELNHCSLELGHTIQTFTNADVFALGMLKLVASCV